MSQVVQGSSSRLARVVSTHMHSKAWLNTRVAHRPQGMLGRGGKGRSCCGLGGGTGQAEQVALAEKAASEALALERIASRALRNQDCVGVWLAWGECQRNNQQLMRYTIDKPALMGGKERSCHKICAVLMTIIATAITSGNRHIRMCQSDRSTWRQG